jgi:hypothetical protein
VQDQYDPWRTGRAVGLGAAFGGTRQLGAEALGASKFSEGGGGHGISEGGRGSRSSGSTAVSTESTAVSKRDQVLANRAKGSAFEQQTTEAWRQQGIEDVTREVTVRTRSGTRTRIDLMGRDPLEHLLSHPARRHGATSRRRIRQSPPRQTKPHRRNRHVTLVGGVWRRRSSELLSRALPLPSQMPKPTRRARLKGTRPAQCPGLLLSRHIAGRCRPLAHLAATPEGPASDPKSSE